MATGTAPSETAAPAPPPPSLFSRVSAASLIGPVIALVAVFAYFSIRSSEFLTGGNIALIMQQVMVVAVLAIGQTLIILTAGIDLSNGLIMAFGNVMVARLAVVNHLNPWFAILLMLLVTTAFGVANGVLVTRLSLPPFIATLGMYSVVLSLTHVYSRDQTVSNLPGVLTKLGDTFPMGRTDVAYGVVLMLVLFLITWYVLRMTPVGRHLYAVGNNPEAARLLGIPVNRVLLGVYGFAGLFYGIAALLLVGRISVGDPNAGQTDNLTSITAVVIGGTSLFGGRGSIFGTLLGAIIVGSIQNGLQLIGVQSIWQSFITGILLIAVVAIDQFVRRRR